MANKLANERLPPPTTMGEAVVVWTQLGRKIFAALHSVDLEPQVNEPSLVACRSISF